MFGIIKPLCAVFDGEPNDPNNPSLTGGEPPQGQPGGGGEPPKNEPPQDQLHEIKVGGETRKVTIQEALDLAQKSAGADQKFQEAADMRKEADKGLKIAKLVDAVSVEKPAEADVRELASLLGEDPEKFMVYLNEGNEATGAPNTAPTAQPQVSAEQIEQALGIPLAEAKQILEHSHRRHIDDAKNELKKISDEAVDKDQIFGKMIVGEDKDARRNAIQDMVFEDVLRKVGAGEPFGAELVAASTQKVRAYLTNFGVPGKPAQYPVVLGLGPGSGLLAETQSDEPIKRVDGFKDEGERNLLARVAQYIRKHGQTK